MSLDPRDPPPAFTFGAPVVLAPDDPATWADLLVRAGIARSKGHARELVGQGAVFASDDGLRSGAFGPWPRVTDADAPVPRRPGWFALRRGRRWSMGHLRLVVAESGDA